jgi:anthranilate synthase/aminodeoxychorismate synthase-like glutamine amidotransferase
MFSHGSTPNKKRSGQGDESRQRKRSEAHWSLDNKCNDDNLCLNNFFYKNLIIRAPRLMHGKTSPILHTGENVFTGLPSPFEATRYHSLIVKRETLPSCLKITAETAEGEIMGLAHRDLPVYGVQFHPESILTQHGKQMLKNFLES